MNQLPLEIENIIMDYYYQLEHTDKFIKCIYEIMNIGFIKDFCESREEPFKVVFRTIRYKSMINERDHTITVNIKKVREVARDIRYLHVFRR